MTEPTVAFVREALELTGAEPERLICEITGTALQGVESGERFVRRLRELGVRVALDDFGAGYGGFSYLKHLLVSFLKIDMQFVQDLMDDPASQHVVEAIVTLARDFGIETVAEGVEDPRVIEVLRDFGVDYAQGYHIGRPAPVEVLMTPAFGTLD